jgi:hypothetical protein
MMESELTARVRGEMANYEKVYLRAWALLPATTGKSVAGGGGIAGFRPSVP